MSYNGTLEIELGGLNAGGEFDQLNHILGLGVADLGGTLDVKFINGFTPSAGDTFEIITAASVVDTFDTLILPSLPGDLLWFLNYGATSVELVSTFAGDFDEDGDVDDEDRIVWEGGFGSAPAMVASAIVPEPSSLVMLVVGLALVGTLRRGSGDAYQRGYMGLEVLC